MNQPENILTRIKSERPPIHVKKNGDPRCIGLQADVLDYLYRKLTPTMFTLETGCGLSTLVFSLSGCHHTAIVPNLIHIEETKKNAQQYNISLEKTHFIKGRSEFILPTLEMDEKLDMVLIDGGHAFPLPFIDWFYTERWLIKDGILIIDDINLKTVNVLYTFLTYQPEWEVIKIIRKTAFFQKKKHGYLDHSWDYWQSQPFNNNWKLQLSRIVSRLPKRIHK